ncbi:LysR family transcriptional regulator, partial [Pseudomonas aeruginosa]
VSHALLGHLHYLEDSLDLGSSEAIKHSVAAGLGISCLSPGFERFWEHCRAGLGAG